MIPYSHQSISKTDIETAKKYWAIAMWSMVRSNFPRVPNEHYKDEWIDWYELFGKKSPPDYVTLNELKEYISKNKISTKITGCRTIRESNGVACSSRNFNLNKKLFMSKC